MNTLPIVDNDGHVWWDGVRLPVVKAESFWTRPGRTDMNRWGFIATLASENGATVCLCFDPTEGEDQVSMWVVVSRDERLINGRVRSGAIWFDSDCQGENCVGCEHFFGAWFEWVTSPAEVFAYLGLLGSLPVKAEVAS